MFLSMPGIGNTMDYEMTYHETYDKEIYRIANNIKKRTIPPTALYFDTHNGLRHYLNPITKKEEPGISITKVTPEFHKKKINDIYISLLSELYPYRKYNSIGELFFQFGKEHYLKPFCEWCSCPESEDNRHIIEHSHICPSLEINSFTNKPKYWIGQYRGKLCKRCNVLEGIIKDKTIQDKITYLKKKGFEETSANIIVKTWYC